MQSGWPIMLMRIVFNQYFTYIWMWRFAYHQHMSCIWSTYVMYMVVDIKVLTLISLESIQYDMEWWLDIFTRSGNGFVCGDEVEPNGWKDKGEYDKRKTTNLSIVARIKMNEKG